MRLARWFMAALFMTGHAWGASAPVVIVMPSAFEAHSDPEASRKGGLLVSMLESSINKQGDKQIVRFKDDLADPQLAEQVRQSFSCIGAESVTPGCPAATLLAGNSDDALARLFGAGATRVLFVRFHAFKSDARIRMRAIVNDAVNEAGGLKATRVFTAVFDSRVPADLEGRLKKDPAAASRYWSEGSPTRMATETAKGLEELRQMLTMLDQEVPADNSVPQRWQQLPSTDALKQAGRLKCGGGGCGKHRVVRDTGDRAWLTTLYAQGSFLYGWSIASLDDATARRYSNILLHVQTTEQ